jgi:potassium channel LctB
MAINDGAGQQNFSSACSPSADAEGPLVRVIMLVVNELAEITAMLSGFYCCREAIHSKKYNLAHIDIVLLVWGGILFTCYCIVFLIPDLFWLLVVVVSTLRIVNIMCWSLNSVLKADNRVTSFKRSLILGMVNFLQLILSFACVYAAFPNLINITLLDTKIPSFGVFLYFSAITQLTIGYGDVTPLSWMRSVAVFQGLSGLALLTVTIAHFVAHLTAKETHQRVASQQQNKIDQTGPKKGAF